MRCEFGIESVDAVAYIKEWRKLEVKTRTQIENVSRKFETIKLNDAVSVERVTEVHRIGDGKQTTKSKSYLIGNKVEHGTIELFDKGIRDKHRELDIFQTDDKEVLRCVNKYFDDPYTIIEELGDEWEESLELLIYKRYDHTIRELDGTPISKRYYFDYMSGITEKNFDLNGLLIHLKEQDSIEVIDGIKSIPYYNAQEDEHRQIEFKVRPTDDEWAKITNSEVFSDMYFGGGGSSNMKSKIADYYGFANYIKRQ